MNRLTSLRFLTAFLISWGSCLAAGNFTEIYISSATKDGQDSVYFQVNSIGHCRIGVSKDGRSTESKVTLEGKVLDELIQTIDLELKNFSERSNRADIVVSRPVIVRFRRGQYSVDMQYLSVSHPTNLPGRLGKIIRKINAIIPGDIKFP